MTTPLRARNEIPLEHTWDTTSIFASDEAWEKAITAVTEQLPTLAGFQGHLTDSAAKLADWFEIYGKVYKLTRKIFTYSYMHNMVDTTNQEAAAKVDRGRGLQTNLIATTAFAEPELLAIETDILDDWLATEPRLTIYKHYFADLKRRQSHIRSAEVEEILGLVSNPFKTANETHRILTNADLTFEPIKLPPTGDVQEIAQGTVRAFVADADRSVRQAAWENYADAHLAYKNAMANCIATTAKQHNFIAKVRHHPSALASALSGSNIPPTVFHNLIETYRRHLPTWHKYWRIRRQALNYDTLREYDIKAPLTQNKPTISFNQAVDWICEGMAPLGEDYVNTMQHGVLQERWVDIYPNKGKREGAFCIGTPGTHPFIFTSYTDDIFSLSTLAHELGHAMHSYYTWQNQPLIYANYTTFVAEVASNFNQALVRAYLLETKTDPDFQIAIIEEAMSNFHRYFFIMPILAIFEYEIHQRVEAGQAIPADFLIGLMADLFNEGYGEALHMDRERSGITWAQFSTHMYLNFYVFQYATGISGAHALAQNVLSQGEKAVDNYLAFLKSGRSQYTLDLLQMAGVDLSTPEPVEQTFAVLDRMVTRLETLILKKIEA